MDKAALIVFAKIPEPGMVKTRLTTLLTPGDAADLYLSMLRDSLRQYDDLGVAVRLYLAPSMILVPEELVETSLEVFSQKGEGLGNRMLNAFLETFAAGFSHIVIIGTDHPTLPTSFLTRAYHALNQAGSVSIGPSEDGGYYLLGMNELYANLFTDIEYSRAAVFEKTLDRIGSTSAKLTVLPEWYDVDTPESLLRLVTDLENGVEGAPMTREKIEELKGRYGELTHRAGDA